SKDTYEGTVTNPLSLNLYSYVRNNPLTHVDPSGHDAIMITNPDLAFGFGHTSIVIENNDGKWYYFYWGDKNVQLTQVNTSYLTDLDKFNKWGNDTTLKTSKGGSVGLAGFSESGYTNSTYVKGDFSASYNEAKKLANSHSINGTNKDYSLTTNNCYIVSLGLLGKGILYNGVSASRFTTSVDLKAGSMIPDRTFGTIAGSITPNVGAIALKEVFYNNSFTSNEYTKQLNEKKSFYQAGNWFTQIMKKTNFNLFRLNVLLGKNK
ncbi:type IV secretion protein Rhs, partial [Paenibacillus turicensis]